MTNDNTQNPTTKLHRTRRIIVFWHLCKPGVWRTTNGRYFGINTGLLDVLIVKDGIK